MKTGRAIVIVVKIVFAGPEELDGNPDLFGDGADLEHVIVGEAAAESTAGALHVDDDVIMRNIENFGDKLAAGFGRLAGRPKFKLAVVIMREAIFGLHGSMGEEGIGVSGFDDFCGGLQGFAGVAVAADGDSRRLLGKFIGAAGGAPAALSGGGGLLPAMPQIFSLRGRVAPTFSSGGGASDQARRNSSSQPRK